DLLERQQLRLWKERIVASEDFTRHAVHAAEITAVSNRYPQVAQLAAQGVFGCTGRRFQRLGHVAHVAKILWLTRHGGSLPLLPKPTLKRCTPSNVVERPSASGGKPAARQRVGVGWTASHEPRGRRLGAG